MVMLYAASSFAVQSLPDFAVRRSCAMVDGVEGRAIVQPELQFFCKIALGLGHNPTLSHRSVLDT
jgi:hypothetical protein